MKLKELLPVIDERVDLHRKRSMGHPSKYITTETTVYLDDPEYREMCLRFAGEMEVTNVSTYCDVLSIDLTDEVEG